MPYKPGKDGLPADTDCTKLVEYVRGGENLKGKDIVLWHITSAHHVPRQEDMFGGGTGSTAVVWSGFDLKPRDLFDATPFFGAARARARARRRAPRPNRTATVFATYLAQSFSYTQ